ncbi:MAG TPA: anti-sigma regulatory factor [Methanotrichaceae archaeon]|nr:anti-sigma regulatory factor [Methanotrichaceae archaeon]
MPTDAEKHGVVKIQAEGDIVMVRKTVRNVTTQMGFGITDVTRVVTAASELARNIFRYAGSGAMEWQILNIKGKAGIELSFIDLGPGIPDISLAMQEGYTTSGGLGMGLPGSKRLVDELDVQSELGKGTIVTIRKWKRG